MKFWKKVAIHFLIGIALAVIGVMSLTKEDSPEGVGFIIISACLGYAVMSLIVGVIFSFLKIDKKSSYIAALFAALILVSVYFIRPHLLLPIMPDDLLGTWYYRELHAAGHNKPSATGDMRVYVKYAKAGLLIAQLRFATSIFDDRKSPPEDLEMAFNYLFKLQNKSLLDSTLSSIILGTVMIDSRLFEGKGIYHLEKAANAGSVEAGLELADFYWNNQDFVKARGFYMRCFKSGYDPLEADKYYGAFNMENYWTLKEYANYRLGVLHYRGCVDSESNSIIEKSTEKAIRYFNDCRTERYEDDRNIVMEIAEAYAAVELQKEYNDLTRRGVISSLTNGVKDVPSSVPLVVRLPEILTEIAPLIQVDSTD